MSFVCREGLWCVCVYFFLRNQLKLKINKLTAKLLQVPNSISSTPCKTGENQTAAVFDRILQLKGACAYVHCSILIIVEI